MSDSRSSGSAVRGFAAHHLAGRHRLRDEAAGDVRVERGEDDAGAAAAGELDHLGVGARAVRRHQEGHPDLDGPPLRVGAVADHDDVVGPHRPAHGRRVHGHGPQPPVQAPRRAQEHLALEDVDDEVGRDRAVGEAGGLARLLDVAAGEVARGDHADDRAAVVGDGDEVGVAARHHEAHVAQRGPLVRARAPRPHDVARAEADVREQLGLRRAAALERPARLRVDLAQADGDVAPGGVEAPLQLGVADRRGDRVEVGVAVPGDVDGAHGRELRTPAARASVSRRPRRPPRRRRRRRGRP